MKDRHEWSKKQGPKVVMKNFGGTKNETKLLGGLK